jgi:hypothetical protein
MSMILLTSPNAAKFSVPAGFEKATFAGDA